MTEKFPGLDRRTFVGGAAGLLGASALSPPVLGAPLTAADFKPTSGETVYFRGWQFRTDVVQGNVDTYNKTFDGHVDYATVTGDYPAVMEKTLIANDKLDVLYANPASAVRYMGGKWLLPASELRNGQEIAECIKTSVMRGRSTESFSASPTSFPPAGHSRYSLSPISTQVSLRPTFPRRGTGSMTWSTNCMTRG